MRYYRHLENCWFFINPKTGELNMKTITMAALGLNLLFLTLTFTAGCSRQELVDCRRGNEQLRQTIDEQKTTIEEQNTQIERLEQVEQNYGAVVIKIVTEMEDAKKELAKTKKELAKVRIEKNTYKKAQQLLQIRLQSGSSSEKPDAP